MALPGRHQQAFPLGLPERAGLHGAGKLNGCDLIWLPCEVEHPWRRGGTSRIARPIWHRWRALGVESAQEAVGHTGLELMHVAQQWMLGRHRGERAGRALTTRVQRTELGWQPARLGQPPASPQHGLLVLHKPSLHGARQRELGRIWQTERLHV